MRHVELLFFAYRDFTSDPDTILAELDFGRAHHRVLHFVNRNPGLRVADLLDILKITKQSLARVLRELVEGGYVEQRMGEKDRRERHLFATSQGSQLAHRLSAPQLERIARALQAAGAGSADMTNAFLYHMIDETDRAAVARLLGISSRMKASDTGGD